LLTFEKSQLCLKISAGPVEQSELITGKPQAIASTKANQNHSHLEVKTKQSDLAKNI
jgi:hypothetical protein